MLTRFQRIVQKSLFRTQLLNWSIFQSPYYHTLPSFWFSNKSSLSPSDSSILKSQQQGGNFSYSSKLTCQQSGKVPSVIETKEMNLDIPPIIQSSNEANFNFKNPYIQQTSQKQVIEQGFLAFFTSYTIRNIQYENICQSHPYQSVGDIIIQLTKHINQENDGFDKKNVEQFYDCLKIEKGIKLPKQVFYQDRMKVMEHQQQVFNVTSVTTRIMNFSKYKENIFRGIAGFGKSYAFALNNYLTFLVWKLINLWGEQSNTKMKDLIFKQLKIFNQFHKINKTKLLTAYEVFQDFKCLSFQFYYELKENDTWDNIINCLLIQCPDIKFQKKLIKKANKDQQHKEKKDETIQLLKIIKKYFQEKQRSFILIIDQGNTYYSMLMQIKRDFQEIIQNQKVEGINNAYKFLYHDVKKYKAYQQRYQRCKNMSDILQVLYNNLRLNNISLCSSERGQVQIYQKDTFPLKIFFNPFHQSGVGAIKYTSDYHKEVQFSNWKQNEISLIYWFQIRYKFYEIIGKRNFSILTTFMEELQIKKKFIQMFKEKLTLTTKNGSQRQQKKYLWQPKIKQLTFKHNFKETILQNKFTSIWMQILKLQNKKNEQKQLESNNKQNSLNNINELKNQIKKLNNSIQAQFLELFKTGYFKIHLNNTIQFEIKYKHAAKRLSRNQSLNLKQKRQLFIQFLLDLYLKTKFDQSKAQQLRISIEMIKIIFNSLMIEMSQKASLNNIFHNLQISNIYELLSDTNLQSEVEYSFQKDVLIIWNPDSLLANNQQKTEAQRLQFLQDYFRIKYLQLLREKWKANSSQSGKQFDFHLTMYLTKYPQISQIGGILFNILNTKPHSFIAIEQNQDSKLTPQQKHQRLLQHYFKQIEKAMENLNIGESMTFQPSKLVDKKKQGQLEKEYTSLSPMFDLIIATKTQDKIQIRTIDLTVSAAMKTIIKKILSPYKFYRDYIENNKVFSQKYKYVHWVICPQSVCKEIIEKDALKQIKNFDKSEVKHQFELHSISKIKLEKKIQGEILYNLLQAQLEFFKQLKDKK